MCVCVCVCVRACVRACVRVCVSKLPNLHVAPWLTFFCGSQKRIFRKCLLSFFVVVVVLLSIKFHWINTKQGWNDLNGVSLEWVNADFEWTIPLSLVYRCTSSLNSGLSIDSLVTWFILYHLYCNKVAKDNCDFFSHNYELQNINSQF